jgi:RNA polymerase sigma factor (sigma-70 family)
MRTRPAAKRACWGACVERFTVNDAWMTLALRFALLLHIEALLTPHVRNGRSLASERDREAKLMGTLSCTLDKVPPVPEMRSRQREVLLIREILAGRRDLFDDLIAPHWNAVRRVVRTKMGHDPDIDDVTQQAVFKAFTHLEQFRFEGGFRTWLIRIALNEVIQNWRRRVASRSVAMEPSDLAAVSVADPKDSPFTLCMRSQTARMLQAALATLPERYRLVVRMRDFEERSVAEVADALRLTASTVKTRHHRARMRMAKILLKLNTTPGPNGTQ